MKASEIRNLIKIAAQACMARDAEAFASLFTTDGALIIAGHQIVGKPAIEKATADYLATREQIQVTIHRIIVENNQAVVEWTWEDTKIETGQRNCAANAIVVEFKAGLICRWREYSG
jgi:uncharacterized protein (TIGR02246 family)